MILNNTIILPSDNKFLTRDLFQSLMQEQDVITILIFGNDEKSKKAVISADARANVAPGGFSRKAAWLLDRAMFPVIAEFINDGDIAVDQIDPEETLALGISLTDLAMCLIPVSENPDFIKMEKIFLEASKI